ncbi:MAG TPA: MFS transporter [Burkholderiaceae bacterium]|jgi:ACS family glucarate transporter-like MFS transporter
MKLQSKRPPGLAFVYVMLFAMTLINYLDRVALSVAAKPIAQEFSLNPIQMGYLFSSFLWTYLLCVIPAGILVDRYGAKRVCSGGMAVWSAATVLTGVVASFAPLLASRLVMGAGEATTYPSGNRFIREAVPEAKRGFATTIFNAGTYAGPAFGAILVGWLVTIVGWRTAFMIAGAIGFAWLVPWLLWFRNSPREDASPASAASAANATNATNATNAPAAGGVGLAGLLRSRSMWGVALTQGCAIYTQYLFLTWLPSYLQAAKGMDLKQAAIYTALPYGCAVVFGVLLGKFSDLILKPGEAEQGKRRVIIAVSLLCSSVILLAPLVDSIALIVAMLSVSLIGIATATSLNMALANDLLEHTADAGKANSLLLIGANVFGILAPIVTGYIVAATKSYNYAFGTAGVLLVAGAVIAQFMTSARIGSAPARAVERAQSLRGA